MPEPLLRVQGLTKRYAGVVAVDEVSFDVMAGTLTSLIGPNGSGKSTLIDCLSGFQTADAGRWWMGEAEVSGNPPWRIVRAGLSRTFQTVRVYAELSVRDNLTTALQAKQVPQWQVNLLQRGRMRRFDERARDECERVAARIGLARVLDLPAGQLSYGQQKLVALGCALVGAARLVVLDEPLAGVNPTLCNEIGEMLAGFRADGVTFLLVEHNMDFVMRHSDQVIVLDQGALLTQGPPRQVQADERVLQAYIGVAPTGKRA